MAGESLSIFEAVILGVVEGLTEFLPVSSTGHLLVVSDLLGVNSGSTSQSADTYAIAIQFGAIIAIVALYRTRLWSMCQGLVGRSDEGRLVLLGVMAAFMPAAVVGAVAGDVVKEALFGPVPVAIAWAIGGIVLLVWTPRGGAMQLQQLSVKTAFIIGCAQTLALWPGVSRSLVTLLAGLALGLSIASALEFSFLLGLVTLTAATVFDTARYGNEVVDNFGVVTPLLGVVAACVTAIVSVRWMVRYVSTKSLTIFGWYRIGLASMTAVLILTGAL